MAGRAPAKIAFLLGVAALIAAVAAFASPPALAESNARFTRLAVAVMPEYDEPRVLVSYYGELNEDVPLPLEMRLQIPADATVERACSVSSATEEYVCGEYSAQPDGDSLFLTYEAVTPIIYVEFYYGSTSGAGERSLDFTLLPPYPVDNLDLFVQEPRGASDFELSPAPAETLGDERFRHHSYNYQGLAAGEPVTIQIAYSRDTDEPSVSPFGASTLPAGDSSSAGIPEGPFFLLGVAAAAVLAFALYAALIRRVRGRRLALSGAGAAAISTVPEEEASYCAHCGARARRGAGFCSACGQAVRRTEERS